MKILSITGLGLLVSSLAVAAPAEEQRIEKKIVVFHAGDGQDLDFDLDLDFDFDLDSTDLECTEDNGHKVCVAHKVVTTLGQGGGGHAARGYLGIHLTGMTGELREHFGAPVDSGVLISKVESGSPAATAGLEVGDVVTAVDGEQISSPGNLMRTIGSREDGDLATLEFYRDGRLQQVTATLGERAGHAMHRRMRLRLGDGDIHELFEGLHGSIGDLDFSAIGEQVHQSLTSVDWEEISARIHEALESALGDASSGDAD